MLRSEILWSETARITIRLPWDDAREYTGPLAACIAFALELDTVTPDHVTVLESERLGVMSMSGIRFLRARTDYPLDVLVRGDGATDADEARQPPAPLAEIVAKL